MADYFPVLSRAVAGLEHNTGEARRAVYERARAAIVRQLRSIDPPLAEEDISRERMQLEEAIQRVEAGAPGGGGATAAPAQPASSAPKPAAPVTPSTPPPLQQKPPLERRPPAAASATPAEAPGPEGSAKPASTEKPAAAARPAPVGEPIQPRPAKRADGRPIIAASGGPQRPETRKRSGPLIALAALVAIAVGAGLFVARDRLFGGGRPAEVANVKAPDAAPSGDAGPTAPAAETPKPEDKSADRLPQDRPLQDQRPQDGPPDGQPPTDAAQTAEPTPAAEPAPPADQQVARAPDAAAPVPPPATPAPAATPDEALQAPIVAQRAVLYEEGPNQQSGEALNGTVLWRTESVSGGANQPLETAIRGDIEIPGRKLRATITIRRNIDATLPASHTIELQFTLPEDFPNAGISNVPGVLMKADESARGAAVAGLSVRVTNGFFLIGLSNLDTERAVNEQLLKDRGWIDVPVLYDNGRRAVLTLEKGTPGSQMFQDAFATWKGSSAAQR